MNKKNISKSLKFKINDWCESISDNDIKKAIKENAIITGGALVSLLQGEKPNDYDVYFKTYESCYRVAKYYVDLWNATKKTEVVLLSDTDAFDERDFKNCTAVPDFSVTNDKRISCFIKSSGVAGDPDPVEEQDDKPKYLPRFFSTNAISLSNGIQIVIRFYGSVGEIHENYDFVHCTCSYDHDTGDVQLPSKALESIINKELVYTGSKYPLCSIIRSRKFIQRGWTINAGQYLKMCLQLNELDLKDLKVFKDQLTGVDSLYFSKAITSIEKKQSEDPTFAIVNEYLFEVIDRVF